MALFPSLRKTLRPDPRAVTPGELMTRDVKSLAGGYIRELSTQLSQQTGREWSFERAVKEGYERIVWVFRPVNVISENQRARKFQLTQGASVVDDHPLLRLLNKQANPLERGPIFRKRLSSQILLSRPGAFVEIYRTRGGDPYELHLLPPQRVRIVPGAKHPDPRVLTPLVDHYELLEPDGVRSRPIDPENVRWFRDPHPMDPYSGMTPLEAAGMSVELDHFARLYNIMWLKNDGRPGGIVAVKGDLEDDEMAVIERKFDKGPMAAGKLTVLSADGLDFVDAGSKPRDMSYQQLAMNAKIELLSAFGVPESVMGYAGGKTFANAEQELLAFWTLTMPPHLSIITDGFDEDSDDDLEGGFDLSDVEVLEKAKDAKLERARTEVKEGLRSRLSYARLAGIDEVQDTVFTRSAYIAAGLQPLPLNQADADAMGLGAQDDTPAPDASSTTGAPTGDPAALAPVETGAAPAGGGQIEGALPTGPGAAQAALGAAAAAGGLAAGGAAAAALMAAQTRVALPSATPKHLTLRMLAKADDAQWATDDVDTVTRDQLELAIQSVLEDLAVHWCERAAARMNSTKSRRHTRHWAVQADLPGGRAVDTKAIDPTYAVDEDSWADESEQATSPLLIAAALIAAQRTWNNLGGAGRLPDRITRAASESARQVAVFIGEAAKGMAGRLMRAINQADQEGMAMPKMVEGVLSYRGRLGSWAEAVAIQASTATTEGSRSLSARALSSPDDPLTAPEPDERPVLQRLVDPLTPAPDGDETPATPPTEVDQTWRTKRDDRVRKAHKDADNQKRPAGGLFEVGGYLMRFPGDPLAPPALTARCRCTVTYRSRRTGRFVSRPTPALEAAP